MATLTHEEARRAYDRIGALQDSQRFYEAPAIDVLLRHAEFRQARSVFELGCGTGRLAEQLLDEFLPATATYKGMDISPEMVRISEETLRRFTPRAEVALTNGDLPTTETEGSYDRFVSTYVLDLLSDTEAVAVTDEAYRLLRRDGLMCLASITGGTSVTSRAVAAAVRAIYRLAPSLIGGCRPVTLLSFLDADRWRVLHHSRVRAFGVTSEILVAMPSK